MQLQKLDPQAQARYETLKQTIKEGRQTFIDVGLAIAEIKEKKLYLCEHATFESFCEKEYGWTARHCHGLAQAAHTVKALPAALGTAVPSKNAATALSKVPPAKRPGVVKAIVAAGKPVTAKAIRAQAPPAKPSKAKPSVPVGPVDASGLVIPGTLLPLWNRRDEVSALLAILSEVRRTMRQAGQDQDPMYGRISFSSALSHLAQAHADIESAMPAYVCPVCGGNTEVIASCSLCKGLGLLSDFYWHTVSQELKDFRKLAVDQQNA